MAATYTGQYDGTFTPGSTSTATHTSAVSYGTTNYNAPGTTSAPGGTDYTAANPYYGQQGAQTYTATTYTPYERDSSGFRPGTVDYGANTPNRYSQFLDQYYNEDGLSRDANGQTAYDISRGQVETGAEAEKTRRSEALKRQLAAMGMSDSGLAFKQNRQMLSDIERQKGDQIMTLTAEELKAKDERSKFLAGLAQTGELHMADLTAREQELAETARQFDTRTDFDSWALTQGLNDNERDRIFKASESYKERALKGELTYADLNQREREIALDAWKFENQQEFDAWAKGLDIDDAQAERIWNAVENEKERESRIDQIIYNTMGDIETTGYENFLTQRTEERKAMADYYYNLGASGGEAPAGLEGMQESNPLAYWAYNAGISGMDKERYDEDRDNRETYRSAMITGFDPTSSEYFGVINQLFEGIGVPTVEITPEMEMAQDSAETINYLDISGKPDDPKYQEAYNSAPAWSPSIRLDSAGGANNYTIENLPEKGSYFKMNGDLYVVLGDQSENRIVGHENSTSTNVYNVTQGVARQFIANSNGGFQIFSA